MMLPIPRQLYLRSALAVAAACATAGCVTPEQPTQLQDVHERLAADCTAGRFSGVMAAAKGDRVIFLHSCGWQDAARRTPIDLDARYKIFSITKSMTATSILRLAERGQIDLDAPIARYLPNAPPTWSGVTIKHLLQHQSHIPDHSEKLLEAYEAGGLRDHSAAMARVIASLSQEEAAPANTAGQGWRYSNFGYELLAYAAATAQKRPFHQILREQVFEPAGMRRAVVQMPEANVSALAPQPVAGLAAGFVGSAVAPEVVDKNYSFIQQGAGAVIATYRDMLAFGAAMNSGGLLSAEMRARNASESVVASETVRYGFGWMIRRVGTCSYWQHDGGNVGYVADLALAPQAGITVTILSNHGFAGQANAVYRKELMQRLLPRECGG